MVGMLLLLTYLSHSAVVTASTALAASATARSLSGYLKLACPHTPEYLKLAFQHTPLVPKREHCRMTGKLLLHAHLLHSPLLPQTQRWAAPESVRGCCLTNSNN